MDCRCRKLSLFFCKFLSAVGVLEQDCRYIFCNFGAMSLVAKTPWKASLVKYQTKIHCRLLNRLAIVDKYRILPERLNHRAQRSHI